MEFSLIIPAFIAGLLTFLAPCTLPLVPAYLGFISGVSEDDLKDPLLAKSAKRKIFFNGLLFIVGFSVVFVVLGTLAGFAGQALAPYRLWLGRIGGVFVILFGLFMLNLVKVPFLSREIKMKTPTVFKKGNPTNSLILGTAFGLGWTPCVGPILGSILTLAATSTTAFSGAFLLAVFSLGLAVPFLLIAVGFGSASQRIERFSKYLAVISKVGGVFLVLLGILLLTNKLGLWISLFFQWFDFINYESLLDYL